MKLTKILLFVCTVCISGGIMSHESGNAPVVPDDFKSRAKGDVTQGGSWGPVEQWPVLAVHATVLPTGDVFAWDATPDDFDTDFEGNPTNFHDTQRNTTRVTVWNPTTNEHKATFNPEGTGDLFCAGSVHLTDGRIIFAGGDSGVGGKNGPSANSNIYDPYTNQWKSTDNLQSARWYSSLATLSNGEIMTIGGSYNPHPEIEIFGFNQQWSVFGGDVEIPYTMSGDYAWLTQASDGSVTYVGPHNNLDTVYTNDRFVRDAYVYGPERDESLPGELGTYRGYGSYAMYDTDKVLISGGGTSVTSTIIVNPKTKQVTETSPMNFGRRQHNLTILADGSVLATGGNSSGSDLFDQNSGVLTPEIWTPETGQWEVMNDMATDRQYHSVALLLPDARVLLAGSGYCIPCYQQNHEEQNAEIFSPPYLFQGPRPVITYAPTSGNYNTDIDVEVQNGITNAHLIKLSSVTHSQSQDQRLVKLDVVNQTNNKVTLRMPASRLLAPPGHYMLFVVKDGVPSEASIIQVGQVLVESGDIMINDARPGVWEYFEIQGSDAHTLTANFNGNTNDASIHVRSGSRPTDPTTSGFTSCAMVSDDTQQCVVTATNDTSWYIGVYGRANSEFAVSVDLSSGERPQSANVVQPPTNLQVNKINSGDYELLWDSVPNAVRYEIIRDGRLVNGSDTNYFQALNLGAMKTHTFQVLAIDSMGSRSTLSVPVEIRTSNDPYSIDPTTKYNPTIPSIPTGLHVYKTTPTQGILLWDRSFDDNGVAGYEVYRNGELIDIRNDAGVSTPQNDLQVGTTYRYQVLAFDEDGNRSARSTPFVTTGSLMVSGSEQPPAVKDINFNPVVVDPPVVVVVGGGGGGGIGRIDISLLSLLIIIGGLRRFRFIAQ